MPNFVNYENIINLFQSLVESKAMEAEGKCVVFLPETEIIQRIIYYTYNHFEKLFSFYLKTLQKIHFWDILVLFFEAHPSIVYINSLDYLVNGKEKSFIWIFLELFHHRQMDKLLVYFRNTAEILKDDLYKLIYNIQKIMLLENFTINSSLFQDFDIFTRNEKDEYLNKNYEEMKNLWNIYYNQLLDYKKEKIQAEKQISASNNKNNNNNLLTPIINGFDVNFGTSNDSTPITKSHSFIDIDNADDSENLKNNSNGAKLFQKYKEILQTFSFEKSPDKTPSVIFKLIYYLLF